GGVFICLAAAAKRDRMSVPRTTAERAMTRREDLASFLKVSRARISPSDVGLPPCARRRAEGLRREEVASLTGMSVSWYTWFEQGRDVQLSAHMLERLSKTLRLSADEREFLFALAQGRPPPRAGTRED